MARAAARGRALPGAREADEIHVDGTFFRKDGSPLQAVLQLPDIARPDMIGQAPQGGVGDAELALLRIADLGKEQPGDVRDVLDAFTKRRQKNGHDVQAVEHFLPEVAGVHGNFQVPEGGGDYTHVHLNGAATGDGDSHSGTVPKTGLHALSLHSEGRTARFSEGSEIMCSMASLAAASCEAAMALKCSNCA